MKKMLYVGASVASYALPVLAFAQAGTPSSSYFTNLIFKFGDVLNALMPIIIALAVVYFLYGVFTYMTAGDDDKKTAAKSKILYGIIGIFVMVSIWGLVNLLAGTFNLQSSARGTNTDIPSTDDLDINSR